MASCSREHPSLILMRWAWASWGEAQAVEPGALHTLAKGARQLVVQEALDTMGALGSYESQFTPTTYVGMSEPLAGAVISTCMGCTRHTRAPFAAVRLKQLCSRPWHASSGCHPADNGLRLNMWQSKQPYSPHSGINDSHAMAEGGL